MSETTKLKQKKICDKKPKKYSSISSIAWAVKNLWKLDRRLLLLAFLEVPVKVAIPLVGTYFSKILIDRIGEGTAFGRLCVICLSFVMVQCLLSVLKIFLDGRCQARHYTPTLIYQSLLCE